MEPGSYCLDNGVDQVYKGTIVDYQSKVNPTIYHRLVVKKCTEETRLEDDPPCGTDEEIKEYLDGKYLQVHVLDEKMNLGNYEEKVPLTRKVKI